MFKPTWGVNLFGFISVLLPLTFDVLAGMAWLTGKASLSGLLISVSLSSMFIFVVFALALVVYSRREFNLSSGEYLSAQKSMFGATEEIQETLSALRALQLLRKEVYGTDNPFKCYELNLIFKDGKRVNIVTHGSFKDLKIDAQLLSTRIGVPLMEGDEVSAS